MGLVWVWCIRGQVGFELCTTLWVFTACVLGEGVERDAFVVGWSFFHIIIIFSVKEL